MSFSVAPASGSQDVIAACTSCGRFLRATSSRHSAEVRRSCQRFHRQRGRCRVIASACSASAELPARAFHSQGSFPTRAAPLPPWVSQKLKERQKTKGIKLEKKKKPGDDIKISLGPIDAIR